MRLFNAVFKEKLQLPALNRLETIRYERFKTIIKIYAGNKTPSVTKRHHEKRLIPAGFVAFSLHGDGGRRGQGSRLSVANSASRLPSITHF